MSEIKLNTIEEAIEDFREGKFVIVVDDEDRENEGDLIIAAELVTPEKINFNFVGNCAYLHTCTVDNEHLRCFIRIPLHSDTRRICRTKR